MSLRQLLVASVFAASASSALATKPLPCPTTGPVQDTIGIIQSDTRTRIESRLRAIDVEKKHQVVLITVNNLEDYGYNTMSELAGAVGNGCKVGYRGVNNGVVVLYTQSPSKYRIELAQSEQYITDAQSSRIIGKSKSVGVCSKDDVSCRLDSITGEIDTLIREEFPDIQSVKEIEKDISKHDDNKTSQDLSDIANNLGLGAIVIIVVGGGAYGIKRLLNSRRHRQELTKLKKQILELSVLLQTEKAKYPTWFQKNHIMPIEGIMSKILEYSDETLIKEYIESTGMQNGRMKTSKRDFEQNMKRIKNAIDGFSESHETIVHSVTIVKNQVASNIGAINLIISTLDNLGFKYEKKPLPNTDEGDNPDATISKLSRAATEMEAYLLILTKVQAYYSRMKTFGEEGIIQFSKLKSKYATTHQEYVVIFGSSEYSSISSHETKINTIRDAIAIAHTNKNIPTLQSLEKHLNETLLKIESSIQKINQRIAWYNSIPQEISQREQLIGGIHPSSEYATTAREYVSKTGKRKFSIFDMSASILGIKTILQQIKRSHSNKEGLDAIPGLLENADKEIAKLKEYIGLGALLTAIIAAEIQQEALRIARIKEEEEEAEEARKAKAAASSNDSDTDWKSGGGNSFNGAGAEDD